MSDPLAKLREDLKTGKLTAVKPAQKPKQTSESGRLLVAIAKANGHLDPEGWAAQVVGYFEKPAK